MLKRLIAWTALPSLLLFTLLSGCGGGGGDLGFGAPADQFELAPFRTPVAGDSFTFTVTGGDDRGDKYAGRFTLEGVGPTTLLERTVTSLEHRLELDITNLGTTLDELLSWAVDSEGELVQLTLEKGDEGELVGTPIDPVGSLPQLAEDGDGGTLWTVILGDGSELAMSWSLEIDGSNRAKLSFTWTQSQGGQVIAIDLYRYEINPEGKPQSVNLIFEDRTTNTTINVSGRST